MDSRTFADSPAVRARVPLLIGLVGASGSGKTFSALRLSKGIQAVTGGDIGVIDTEARRALHYADAFKFRHLPFDAPFGPLDYLAAIEHFFKKGVHTIVVDSMSHEHEGPGGVLEMHETETQRLVKAWNSSADKVKFAAWQKPKSERRRLLNSLLQMPANFIFCFRAKEKLKVVPGQQPKQLGWMPIAGEEFVYEMTLNCLLYPNSGGVPSWHPEELGEKAMVKLPEQFKQLFAERKPLSEATGEALARWAEGGAAPKISEAEEKKGLLAEVQELLAKHRPGKSAADQKARGELAQAFLGAGTWKAVTDLPMQTLREGLNNLQLHLEGIPLENSLDDERVPGGDDEDVAAAV